MIENKKELEELTNCAMCANMCKYTCPVYIATGSETATPQKIARLILYNEKGFIEDNRDFADAVFLSTLCGACERHCIYPDHDLRKFIHRARVKAFQSGKLPEAVKKRVETFRKFGNPDGEREILDKGSGEVGHFVSCSAYKDGNLLQAMSLILGASGLEVREFGGRDLCCGAPLYFAGDMEGFRAAARKMKEEIEKRKLGKVIADCPTCLKMMTQVYPEAGAALDMDLMHSAQFMEGLLKDGKLRVRKANGTVAYHDPCNLANDLGITSAPREIIRLLGYELREPAYSKENTHCCGGAYGAKTGEAGVRDQVSSRRTEELKETGANLYVSACPTCKAVLSGAGIKDISELVSGRISNE